MSDLLESKMDKATARPWRVQRLHHARDLLWLQIGYEKPDGTQWGPICRVNCPAEPMPDGVVAEIKHMATPDEKNIANAELIVRAVNCHDEYQSALAKIARIDYSTAAVTGACHSAVQIARAALAKAQGTGE